jgi:TfoX/Sxy family transcriptional regulator of competence genes
MARAASPGDVLAQRVRGLLHAGHVREVRMFGGLSFMVDELMAVAARRDGDLLVRCDPARREDLLLHGGQPAYMGKDRQMGPGWLTVPSERIQQDEELASWIQVGIDSRNASA